jgi:hypothetical protein
LGVRNTRKKEEVSRLTTVCHFERVKGIWGVVDTETKKDVGKGRRVATALMCKRMNERTVERERELPLRMSQE